MQVQLSKNSNVLLAGSKKNIPLNKLSLNNNGSKNTISFLDLPAIAFKSRIINVTHPISFGRTVKSSTLNYSIFSQPAISVKQNSDLPEINLKAYSQDPLVNNHRDIYRIKDSIKPGPESERIKIVDENSELAKPDTTGNFIYETNTPQFDRVNAFVIAYKTLDMYEKALGREIPWAFNEKQLTIRTRAGEGSCAYYHRGEKGIKLFYFKDVNNPEKTVYTARMADLISHETGHAVLDSLRPTYIGWGKHGRAVHEGIADITAMLLALNNESLIRKMIKETGGNLRKDNVICRFAEQYGIAKLGNAEYLRNLNNNLTMSSFGPQKEMKEEHNFGRLMGGMYYDMIVEIANKHARNMSLEKALEKTAEDLTKIVIKGVGDFASDSFVYFEDIAFSFLKADLVNCNGQYQEELKKVFLKREIVNQDQIDKWEKEQANLPEFKLIPECCKSEEDLLKHINSNLKTLNLPPSHNYKLDKSYTNSYGEAFFYLQSLVNLKPGDKGYEPDEDLGGVIYSPKTYNLLKLGFDRFGKLIHMTTGTKKDIEIIYTD